MSFDRDPERTRLAETAQRQRHWRRWGPYLSGRQWGTVREDYSANGDAWNYVTHDQAPSYTYRWGEEGLGGISDNHQRLCFAPALWNRRDSMLKERLFGLTNPQGNHGEDVKEYYWYLDCTPTHSYMQFLYRYPQSEFPYRQLLEENARRDRSQPEFELADTGIFDENRYFDVYVEYAKAGDEDVLIRIEAINRGPEEAPLHLLPTLWFRNDWIWREGGEAPTIELIGDNAVRAAHPTLGQRWLGFSGSPECLFTENLSNMKRLYGVENSNPFVKDAFARYLLEGESSAVGRSRGSRFASHYQWKLAPGESRSVRLRLSDGDSHSQLEESEFDAIIEKRRAEADRFYEPLAEGVGPERRAIQRQAFAGLLWSKQWYHLVVEQWLTGDPTMPAPPAERWKGRNSNWLHLYNDDVLNMPDKWEYPWYATWDSAFHAIALALVDPEHAKRQIVRFTREWYMHPNGQLPAYEWSFDDVNPPVHAWAAYRVYKIEQKHWRKGEGDRLFLERVFHKLLMNFTWWVNRKDQEGRNLFEGGFLGMDNIGLFDRSSPLPGGSKLLQSDSTSWMAMFCLSMLRIAWELSRHNSAYQDIASKFYEHFLYIAAAMAGQDPGVPSLWDQEQGFFFDHVSHPDGTMVPIEAFSMVGLIPLLAVEILEKDNLDRMSGFKRRMEWFEENRPDLTGNITCAIGRRCILSVLTEEQLRRVLTRMLDEDQFLSDYGIRSLSKLHQEHPFRVKTDQGDHQVDYQPAESRSGLFGGNSNWRGPVWFPVNFLIIEALQRYHHFWKDGFKIEFPTGSGREMTLGEVSARLSRRLISLFEKKNSSRPVLGARSLYAREGWLDRIPFHEYFHGDTGEGLGASHQTGWTALVAKLIYRDGAQE